MLAAALPLLLAMRGVLLECLTLRKLETRTGKLEFRSRSLVWGRGLGYPRTLGVLGGEFRVVASSELPTRPRRRLIQLCKRIPHIPPHPPLLCGPCAVRPVPSFFYRPSSSPFSTVLGWFPRRFSPIAANAKYLPPLTTDLESGTVGVM